MGRQVRTDRISASLRTELRRAVAIRCFAKLFGKGDDMAVKEQIDYLYSAFHGNVTKGIISEIDLLCTGQDPYDRLFTDVEDGIDQEGTATGRQVKPFYTKMDVGYVLGKHINKDVMSKSTFDGKGNVTGRNVYDMASSTLRSIRKAHAQLSKIIDKSGHRKESGNYNLEDISNQLLDKMWQLQSHHGKDAVDLSSPSDDNDENVTPGNCSSPPDGKHATGNGEEQNSDDDASSITAPPEPVPRSARPVTIQEPNEEGMSNSEVASHANNSGGSSCIDSDIILGVPNTVTVDTNDEASDAASSNTVTVDNSATTVVVATSDSVSSFGSHKPRPKSWTFPGYIALFLFGPTADEKYQLPFCDMNDPKKENKVDLGRAQSRKRKAEELKKEKEYEKKEKLEKSAKSDKDRLSERVQLATLDFHETRIDTDLRDQELAAMKHEADILQRQIDRAFTRAQEKQDYARYERLEAELDRLRSGIAQARVDTKAAAVARLQRNDSVRSGKSGDKNVRSGNDSGEE